MSVFFTTRLSIKRIALLLTGVTLACLVSTAQAGPPRWLLIHRRQVGDVENAGGALVDNFTFHQDGSKAAGVGITNASNPTTSIFGTTNSNGFNRVNPLDELNSITEQAVKVTDFGLGGVGGLTTQSIMQSGSLLTEEGKSISGTLAYMSPEQKEGKDLDARSDLFSCGIVLFEMLTGERPQGGDLPSALRPEVPQQLDGVFQRAYTRWERRYESTSEMLAALTVGPKAPSTVRSGEVPLGGGYHCPACRTVVHRDDQFCIRCGHQLSASVPRCPNQQCRAYVHSADRYCILCGTSLQVLKG